MQKLANSTNKIVGGYEFPVAFEDGTDFLSGLKGVVQQVDVVDEFGRIETKLMGILRPDQGLTRVQPVWFFPDKGAVLDYQALRVFGYTLQQAEYAKDIME
jgi:hypothetical protein